MTSSSAERPQTRPAGHPTGIRELTVLRTERLTPRMIRVVLGGPEVAGFTHRVADERIKIVFPDPDTGVTRPPVTTGDGQGLDWPRPFPPTREYTVRRFDRVAGEVSVDFVLHAGGLAAGWAEAARPGDRVWIAGPKPGLIVPPEFTFHLLLGDQTALPAIGRWLEELPVTARARVVIQVPDAAEHQPLAESPGIEVTWIHEDDPAHTGSALGDALTALSLPPDEHVYLWAAGEAAIMKPIRRWARDHGFDRRNCDIAGYWRRGFGSPSE